MVLSHFSVLQAMESWAGPGNEARRMKQSVLGWVFKTSQTLALTLKLWTPALHYLCSIPQQVVESVLWQEDSRMVLVEKVYYYLAEKR